MKKAKIKLDFDFQKGSVDKRIFGGFLEHLGRAVYQGVYDPDSPKADEHGFRTDVIKALQRLNLSVMRYPGGNFASGYHWMDGIGDISSRPVVRELAWQSIEPNKFGTNEFMLLCSMLGWEPMLTVNLGTGSPEEARNWVEYCNCNTGTKYADMRAASGRKEPYNVKLWCVGNEMDGKWQLGYVPAEEYAVNAQKTIKMMKDVSHIVEAIVCGSCSPSMSTYMDWDRKVLEYLGDYADYISLHRYVGNPSHDTNDYLAVGVSIDKQIEEMDSVCRFVQAKLKTRKRPCLCFDEWNVWYRNQEMNGKGKFAPHLLEEIYNMEDALVVAQFLNSFIRHADVLKIANIAQIVNVIAPVITTQDNVLIQSIFYPFEMISKRREGISLMPVIIGDTYESKNYGVVNVVDSSAIANDDFLHVFLVNRLMERLSVTIDVCAGKKSRIIFDAGEILTHSAPEAVNSCENPSNIMPCQIKKIKVDKNKILLTLPALSFLALSFKRK